MKIRFLQNISGTFSAIKGEIVDLSTVEAQRYIDAGIADADGAVDYNVEFGLQVARGLVAGITAVNVNGRAPDGIQTTITDVWARADSAATQQIWLAPTAARIHAIVSDSTSDSSAGVGARIIRISGLKTWSSEETSENITMNGTTSVDTVNSYVIINRAIVLTSGATSIQVGNITATAATDNTISFKMQAGVGRTQMAIYGLPSGKTLHIKRVSVFMNEAVGTTRIDIQVRVNTRPDVLATMFTNRRTILLTSGGTSALSIPVEVLGTITGPAIIKIQAIATVNDTDLSAGFDGWLVTT